MPFLSNDSLLQYSWDEINQNIDANKDLFTGT